MRIKVLSGGRKNIELPLSDAELNLQMRWIGIEETVPMCRLVEVSEKDNPLHRFEGQTVNMDEVNFFAKRMESLTEYERKVLSAYAEDYGVATMQDLINLTFSMKGMEAINRITCNDGDFVGAFRQNVIRVIGSYGGEQEPDEYDEKIKEKEEEMVALIAENARVGSYTDQFDERYRRIAEEITTLKEEQIEVRRKKKLADSYEQRLKDMDSFLEKQTCQIPEFDNDLVRRLIANIKVVSADKLIIQFQSGIVMEQEIRYE